MWPTSAALSCSVADQPWSCSHREVLYWSDILKGGLHNSRAWQFVQENGQGAMFEGYKLSLDLMAKNAFTMLFGLHDALIVLLVVEAVVVNVLALSYLFLLLKNVGAQHMRCFAPFLALPSAVMRTMASRPCQVGGPSGTCQVPVALLACIFSVVGLGTSRSAHDAAGVLLVPKPIPDQSPLHSPETITCTESVCCWASCC